MRVTPFAALKRRFLAGWERSARCRAVRMRVTAFAALKHECLNLRLRELDEAVRMRVTPFAALKRVGLDLIHLHPGPRPNEGNAVRGIETLVSVGTVVCT